MARRGFTLLELLIVMSIMSIMAVASATSYRTMRRGLEESAVVKTASQFIRLSYQRSKIDRVPVNVYFWNETVKEEDDDGPLTVVGRAVAVRKLGRITARSGQMLIDEFGDLDVYGVKDDEGDLDENSSDYENDSGTWLYRVNGDEQSFQRTLVSRSTAPFKTTGIVMISYPKFFHPNSTEKEITSYAFYILPDDKGGIDWKKGDAYGLEFGDFSLPNGYIFDTTYSSSVSDPYQEIKVMNFNPTGSSDGGGQTIQISALRPNSQGTLAAKTIDKTVAPNRDQQAQNE